MSYLLDSEFMGNTYIKSLLQKKELIMSVQNAVINNPVNLTYKELAANLNITLGKFRYLHNECDLLLTNIEEEVELAHTIYVAFLSCMTSVEIAESCYCSTSKVFSTLNKLKIDTKHGGRAKRKEEITKNLLRIYDTYAQANNNDKKPLTTYSQLTYKRLASLLGISYNYAWQLCEENKIQLSKCN